MLTIRREQIEIFETADSRDFERQLVVHVREAFPKHCRFLDAQRTGEIVRYGIEHSRTVGFVRRGPVSLWIDLSVLLGRDFDSDPQLPWARQIICDALYDDELQRAQRLHAAAMDYLDAVSGGDNQFIDAAQRRLVHEQVHIEFVSPEAFTTQVSARLEQIWPEKYQQLRDADRRTLIRLAVEKASLYDMQSGAGALLCAGLMYMLGSGFDHDPMFAWLRPVLVAAHTPDVKITHVHNAAVEYLRQWCA